MMTDPLADMLTRIRNASKVERPYVDMPATIMKIAISHVLIGEGFVIGHALGAIYKDELGQNVFKESSDSEVKQSVLRIYLKYGPEGERVIRHIQRGSKPGCRKYLGCKNLSPVLNGLGIRILSTSQGVMSDRRARSQRLGGEIVAVVW